MCGYSLLYSKKYHESIENIIKIYKTIINSIL